MKLKWECTPCYFNKYSVTYIHLDLLTLEKRTERVAMGIVLTVIRGRFFFSLCFVLNHSTFES
jgi:hypothetical protein